MLQPVVVNGIEKPCAVEFGLDSAGQERIVRAGISDGVFSIEDEHFLNHRHNIAYVLGVVGLHDREIATYTNTPRQTVHSDRRRAYQAMGDSMPDAIRKSFAPGGIFTIQRRAGAFPRLTPEELLCLEYASWDTHGKMVRSNLDRPGMTHYVDVRRSLRRKTTGNNLTLLGSLTLGYLSKPGPLPCENPFEQDESEEINEEPAGPKPDVTLAFGKNHTEVFFPDNLDSKMRIFILGIAQSKHTRQITHELGYNALSMTEDIVRPRVLTELEAKNRMHLITRCHELGIFRPRMDEETSLNLAELTTMLAVSMGESVRETTERLQLPPHSVRGYRAKFVRKVKAQGLGEALMHAYASGDLPILQEILPDLWAETENNAPVAHSRIKHLYWRNGLMSVSDEALLGERLNLFALRSTGLNNRDVAQLLDKTPGAVTQMVSKAFAGLGATKITGAILKLFDRGVFERRIAIINHNFKQADWPLLDYLSHAADISSIEEQTHLSERQIKRRVGAMYDRIGLRSAAGAITLARMSTFWDERPTAA